MEILSHLSFSYKSTYDICPYKCYRQYHLKELYKLEEMGVIKPNYYLEYGSLVHKILEMIVRLNIYDFSKVLKFSIPIARKKLRCFSKGDISEDFWMSDLKRDLKNAIDFLSNLDIYNREHGTEEFFKTDFEIEDLKENKVFSQRVIGIVDLWYRDGDDLVFVDYKTGKNKSQRKVDEMEQLIYYTWLIEDNLDMFNWCIDSIVPCVFYVSTGKMIVSRFRGSEEIDRAISDLGNIISNGDFSVKNMPPRYICNDCFGNYKCKYLDNYYKRDTQ